MKRLLVEFARDEARRFIATVDHLTARANSEHDWPELGNKETGAVRRASMDLTRALAALRRRN